MGKQFEPTDGYSIEELRTDQFRVIASVSGGKDSTAMCLHLKDLGIPFEAVHFATGWENAETDRYLCDELPEALGIPLKVLQAEVSLPPDLETIAQGFEQELGGYSAMVRVILKKGMFPARQFRFCTEELKIFPVRDYIEGIVDAEPVNAVGIRGGESAARSKMPVWEYNKGLNCDVWRPIHTWTTQDVIDIHRRHGVLPNRNYFQGADRVGCWPCIFARKSEIRHLAETDPERIDLLERLEKQVTELAQARYKAKGETLKYPRSWFQQRMPKRRLVDCAGCGGEGVVDGVTCDQCYGVGQRIRRDGTCMPIREVIEWSKTARGGRQYELFTAGPNEAGCVRWGMCDMPGVNDE